MRVTAIEIENFKGISDRVRVELKPITLLFGANSAGKSTILHALLYMKDVLDRRNLDAIRTPVSGRALDLGGFRRFVHAQDLNRTIRIAVCLELTGKELPEMAPDYDRPEGLSSAATKKVYAYRRGESRILEKISSAKVGIEVRWDPVDQSPVAFAYTVGLNGQDFIRIERAETKRRLAKVEWCNPATSRSPTEEEREARSWDLAEDRETTQEERNEPVSLLSEILPHFTAKKWPLVGLKNWLPAKHDPIPNFFWQERLSLPEVNEESEARAAEYENDRTDDYREVAKMRAWDGTRFLARLIVGSGQLLQNWLKNLRYIGPLRARPPRNRNGFEELSDWSEGLAAWKALQDEDNARDLIDHVSQWLAGTDRLNSGYELRVKRSGTVDPEAFRRAISAGADKTQLLAMPDAASKVTEIKLVESRSRLELDPSDVGVGVSQVLPIVVGAVLPGASVVAIEQPELHIHPAMQVALGDLFIEGATKRGMSFLIETHSEHLMLRLLRRIRERVQGELPSSLPEFSSDDLIVLYVERSGSERVEILSIGIDQEGKFVSRWPRGFFPERMHEALPKAIREQVESKARGVQ